MFSLSGIETLERVRGTQDRFSTIFLDSSQESVQSYRGCVSIYLCTKSFTFISSFGCHSPENMSVVKSYFAFSRQVATKQHQITILAVYYFMTAARSSFRNFIQLSLCIKTNDSSTTAEQQLTKLLRCGTPLFWQSIRKMIHLKRNYHGINDFTDSKLNN